ncbi:hypothetical protein TDB9533_01643 [Thalassocella blandensis]|nr:hypothetical protein TDB9533_01643 [Thalassocella blandensis]
MDARENSRDNKHSRTVMHDQPTSSRSHNTNDSDGLFSE